jgi:hypothetical protein
MQPSNARHTAAMRDPSRLGASAIGHAKQKGRHLSPREMAAAARSALAVRGVPILEVGPSTPVGAILDALESIPSNRFVHAERHRPAISARSVDQFLKGDRYTASASTTIYSSSTPPTDVQRRVLLETILEAVTEKVGLSLRRHSPSRSEYEIDLLRQNLRLQDVSQEASLIRLLVRVSHAAPILKAWGSLSDQLTMEHLEPSATFRWARASDTVEPLAAEEAKRAVYSMLEDACIAYAGENQIRPRDILPQRAMTWFDTPAVVLNAKFIRELGLAAERIRTQYKTLPVEGPETVHELIDFMQTLESETYICARRERSGRLVLKSQLHPPSAAEDDRAVEWMKQALKTCAAHDAPDGPATVAIKQACWKIHEHRGGLTAMFLSSVIDELRLNPSIRLEAPPYYGEGHHDPRMRLPRRPLPREAPYRNVLTKMKAFAGEEFDSPTEPGVLLLSADELESCRAVVRNNRLETLDGIDIRTNMRHAMRSGKYLVYVMSPHGELYVGADKTVQHSSFLHQVADAGQMEFDDETGMITLNPWSGHMTPDESNTRQTEHWLNAQGIGNVKVIVIPSWD